MTTTDLPIILDSGYSELLHGRWVALSDSEGNGWITTDRERNKVEVFDFYENGCLITAEGCRYKKDGTPYIRRQCLSVEVPANVREALGR